MLEAASQPAYQIDRHVPYLLNHVGGGFARNFGQRLRAHGLTMTLWRVIHSLRHLGPTPLVQLAGFANFDISTLSRVVSDLETRGLVTRTKTSHGRRPAAMLTNAGEACVQRLMPEVFGLEAELLEVLSAGERQLLIELLQKLDARIGNMARTPPEN